MREIVDGILTWSWFSQTHGYDFNGHLIRHPGGNICVDPVEPSEADLDAIAGEGVTRIILTNRNHSRAANRVRARTGARTAIHADDADHARGQDTELDGDVTVGGRIGPLEVIGAAGKSPGEVALFWRGRGILIVGAWKNKAQEEQVRPQGPVRRYRREAQRHVTPRLVPRCTAALNGRFRVPHGASVQPHDRRAVLPGNQRHEPMLRGRIISVRGPRLAPREAAVSRQREHRMVGVGSVRHLLQPVREPTLGLSR